MKRTLKLHFFESLESTQKMAKQLTLEHQKLHVITAYEQTGGQGTFGKSWLSPKDQGLYTTLAFHISQDMPTSSLSHLAAVAVCQTLTTLHPRIKWPNDILIEDKKISGVLTEITEHGVFVGIGINIKKASLIQRGIDQPITSWDAYQTPPDLETVAHSLALHFLDLLGVWEEKGFNGFKSLYCSYFKEYLQSVIIDTPTGLQKGTLIDFSAEGYPLLKTGLHTLTLSHAKHINLDL